MDKGTDIKDNTQNSGKVLKRILKAVAWIAGIWIAILLTIQIVLTPSVLDRIIDRYASAYVDGKISVGKASVSAFRHFPSIGLTLEGFSITYPSDRYEHIEKLGAQGHLIQQGSGAEADTLASFEKLSVGVNLPALITGKINIPYGEITTPRIFLHRYKDGQANWDLINIAADTTSEDKGFPELKLGKIRMRNHPHVVYTDSKDTIFALANLRSMRLNGKLDAEKTSRNKIGLLIDSLTVAGRVSYDTLAFRLDHFGIVEEHGEMNLHAKAKALLATRTFGRLDVPIEIKSALAFPKDSIPAFTINGFEAEIASVPISAQADLRFKEDRASVTANVRINECKAKDIIDNYLKDRIPASADISTDAAFSVDLECTGDYIYSTGSLPEIDVKLDIPSCSIRHKEIKEDITLRLAATAHTSGRNGIATNLETLELRCNGLDLTASANIQDIFEENFPINLEGNLQADLKDLMNLIPMDLGMEASGKIAMNIKGDMRPSHLDIYRFSQSELEGKMEADSIFVVSENDSLHVDIRKLDMNIGPQLKTSRIDSSKTYRLLALTGIIGNADIRYGTMELIGDRVKLSAMNSIDGDTTTISRLGGKVSAAKLLLTDAKGMEIELKGTDNGFQMLPKKDKPEIPVLTVNSSNDRIMLKDGTNRIILTDAKVGGMASMNSIERKQKAKMFMDSLAKVYPDIPKDSLLRHIISKRQTTAVPEWMLEKDFHKNDLDLRLDETLSRYFREWDLYGNIDVRTGILMTPYFPTRNILRGLEVTFDNNRIGIDSLKVRAGNSEIAAKGELTGLRRALLGRGILNLDLDINSNKVNANELLNAYNSGSRYVPPQDKEAIAEATDAEFFKMVTSDTLAVKDSVTPLIVIPANFNADIRLNASDITYSDLEISALHSKLVMRERCVQITETNASTNMGQIGFEGFYGTRSKQNIKAGFSFNLKDITAEKVIDMMPAVDSIMPLLKSFKGNLDCELAATASIDTSMNIIPPSINGIIRIGGRHLSIQDSEIFSELAGKLKFKNRDEGYIDQMSVEGVISDSMLEVFPFLVKIDRYTLAMSGIQNMDESFKYHVSVLRSPLLIRLGVDLYGDNFDKMKFKIGKAKYKSTNIPVFSSVIDTTKINLVTSIRDIFKKGVEAAVSEHEKKEAIEKHKEKIGYVRVVDQEMEALSERERKQMEVELQEDKPKENIR